jgi:hypothetical protein
MLKTLGAGYGFSVGESARKSEGDLPSDADAANLARFVTVLFQGMTVQAINGAGREDMLRLADTDLRVWPK